MTGKYLIYTNVDCMIPFSTNSLKEATEAIQDFERLGEHPSMYVLAYDNGKLVENGKK